MVQSGRYFIGMLLLCSIAMFLAACGKKTLPVPPQTVIPEPVSDLRTVLSDDKVILSWSYPTRMVNGKRLETIDHFKLYRAVVALKDYCSGCPLPFGKAIEVQGGILERLGSDKTASYTETDLMPGFRYFYKVRSRAQGWLSSEDSNIASFIWDTPTQAPEGLRIKEGDRILTLSWRKPVSLVDNTPIEEQLLYEVFRSIDGQTFEPIDSPYEALSFTDEMVENGRPYYYKVRAVRLYEKSQLPGMTSLKVTGTPRDRTAPASPQNLVAVRAQNEIKLLWERVQEEDLAYYRVYRRTVDPPEKVMLDEVKAPMSIYIDSEFPNRPGSIYYSVTAVDNSIPANESVFSKEAKVEITR